MDLRMAAHPSSSGRLPSLDGLRALSITSVLFLHLSGTRNFLPYKAVEPFNPGDLGVRTFFVISGFLITSLVLRELDTTGRISLKNFYARRVLRIFPAFYFYIAITTVVALFLHQTVDGSALLHALTYTVNYQSPQGAWIVAHLWSLSVEEQFYLLWPATLFFIGKRRGLMVAAGVLLVVPCIRLAYWMMLPEHHYLILKSFETSCDPLAAGCLLAGTRERIADRYPVYLRALRSRWFLWIVPLLILGCSMMFQRPRIHYLIAIPVENLLLAILIDRCVRFPNTAAGRFLNLRPLAFIGVLSYSLYLWQQPFCVEWRNHDAWWSGFPQNLAFGMAAALASYYLIERPFLKLKTRFGPPSRNLEMSSAAPAVRVRVDS